MASHAQIEAWWAGRRCEGPHVQLDLNGRFPVRVQPELETAALWLSDAIVGAGYRSPMGATGSYHCRRISGSNTWSLHAYAVAIDWDYGENPYDRNGAKPRPGFGTDPRFLLTEAQVNAVEAIKNDRGESIWRWLGWTIADFMHFQVDVPPDRCAPAGTQPIPPPTNGANVYLPLTYGMGFAANPARQDDVEWMQRALYRAGLFDSNHGFDGKYGDDSADAVSGLHGPDTHNDGRVYGSVEHDLLLRMAYSNGGVGGYRAHIHKTDEGTPIE